MLPKKSYFEIHPDIQRAQRVGNGVVALESAVITHGLPAPANVELALEMEERVAAGGAVAATIAVLGGKVRVGLERSEIERLAGDPEARKVSVRDLAAGVHAGWAGGTTVAATIFAAAVAGIDVSADLPQLARTPVIVVCSGAKVVLDLPATLEYLETYSIPVIGYRTDEFPAFYAAESGLPVMLRLDEPEEIVEYARKHWEIGVRSAVVVVQPPPKETAMDRAELDSAVEEALRLAREAGVRGAAVTPFLLEKLSELTGKASLDSNLDLLRVNADLAAELAQVTARRTRGRIGFV